MTEIRFQNQAAGLLKKLSEKLADLSPVMAAISEDMISATEDNFRTEGARLGEPWQGLSPSRIKQRGNAHPILRDSSLLVKSIQNSHTSHSASIGTNLAYAEIHQFGVEKDVTRMATTRLRTSASGELIRQKNNKYLAVFAKSTHKRFRQSQTQVTYTLKIPARPFIGLNKADIEQYKKTVMDWVVKK